MSPLVRLIAGAATVSAAPVFVRVVNVPPTDSAFYRTLLGGLILVVLLRARHEKLFAGRAALAALVAAGAFFAADLWAWHRSIWIVGPGLATLLANFQVFFLALAGLALFGERFRWQLAVGIPLALVGLSLIVGFDWTELGGDYSWGIGYGLLTAVFYAGYLLSLRRARMRASGSSPLGDMAVVSLISAVLLGISATVEGGVPAVPTVKDGTLLLAYAAVAQVLGWVLISSALRHVPASNVGLILLLQPTLAFVWDVMFFARPFGVREAVGAALTLFAIWLGSRGAGRAH